VTLVHDISGWANTSNTKKYVTDKDGQKKIQRDEDETNILQWDEYKI
jgi:hypothetical protein